MPGLKACIEMMYFDSVCQISTLAKPGVSPLDKAMAKMTRKPQHVANVRPDVPYILFFVSFLQRFHIIGLKHGT